MVNAHSHAFQRAIRGATHRRGAHDPSSFWSWREAMYRAAATLDPEALFAVTRACYREMLRAGITCVGEFHYLHHTPDGRPYADPNELSRQVIRAAEVAGIRLVLLEVYYARAGADREPCPSSAASATAASTPTCAHRHPARRGRAHRRRPAQRPRRPPRGPARARRLRPRHGLPMHAHVSEQPQENVECQAEHGLHPRPRCSPRPAASTRPGGFTAVHAIHLEAADFAALAGQHVCACPTTEADLGDGIIPAASTCATASSSRSAATATPSST
jgi:formimidoylglutamate deiminase